MATAWDNVYAKLMRASKWTDDDDDDVSIFTMNKIKKGNWEKMNKIFKAMADLANKASFLL